MAGLFITFEGPEGAGKSTQVKLLVERLIAEGREVVSTREPGGTRIGEQIRSLLLDRSSVGMAAETEALLLTAARAQHVQEVILPALERGATVLCDRFVESTLAYQGGGRGLPIDQLRDVQRLATRGIEPDMRILLDIDVEQGIRRRLDDAGSSNRLDEESLAFHERVRAAYLAMVEEDSERWQVIDADRVVEEIARDVWSVVQNMHQATG